MRCVGWILLNIFLFRKFFPLENLECKYFTRCQWTMQCNTVINFLIISISIEPMGIFANLSGPSRPISQKIRYIPNQFRKSNLLFALDHECEIANWMKRRESTFPEFVGQCVEFLHIPLLNSFSQFYWMIRASSFIFVFF